MKFVLMVIAIVASTVATTSSALAKGAEVKNGYLVVTGQEALKDHGINQYDDSDNPPQGYLVQLPEGYHLQAVDVESGGSAICGVSKYDWKTQSIRIDGFSLETDEQGCNVILTIFEKATKKYLKVNYAIEQVGT